MPDISPLIKEAKRLLELHPYDVAHDLAHHERVWENAQQIFKMEKLEINEQALKIACFWHDVSIGMKDETENRQIHIDETCNYLFQLMKKYGIREETQKITIDAIRDHGFEKKKQLNVEGEILFDADKLDAIDPKRYDKLKLALKNKKLSKIKIFMMKQAAKIWLPTMRNRYHFKFSITIHDKKIEHLLNDQEIVTLGKEIGIDIPKLLK